MAVYDESQDYDELEDGEGICPACGGWGCVAHLREIREDMEKFVAGIKTEILEFLQVHDPKLAHAYQEGEQIIVTTGEEEEFEKIEGAKEEWVLPSAPDQGGIRVMGGKMFYGDPDLNDKPVIANPKCSYLDIIRDEHLVTSDGTPRSFRLLRANKSNVQHSEWIREEAMKIVPRLKRQLMLAIEAESRVARLRGQKQGSVDGARLSQVVASGKNDVFAKRGNRKTVAAAVQIVLDASGSMVSSPNRGITVTKSAIAETGREKFLHMKIGCAAVLAYALGEVCSQLSIPCEIVALQANAYFYSDMYGIEYKRFNEPWAMAKDRMGAYLPDAGADVPFEAAQWAAKRLLARTEDSRIMLFLSDANSCNYEIEKLGDFANELKKKANIKMIGVGICSDSMKEFMKEKSECVLKIEDLTDAVFVRLAKLIHPA